MFGDAPLPNALIQRLLVEAWSLRVDRVEYAAIGYGSYHWVAGSPAGTSWLVTADADDAPVGVAYELADLLAGEGLSFVRAPVRHCRDGVVRRHDDWMISVWPWLEGRTSSSHLHESPADLAATLRCVRRLHDHDSGDRIPQLVEDWRIPDRPRLVELLGLASDEWPRGLFTDEVRQRLGDNEARVRDMFARYDQLAAEIGAHDDEYVITHGEPHAGNVVHTDGGTKLIDWDTARWAPRERDLWSLTDQEGWRQAYGDDMAISEDALEVYRTQWALVEIADFATSLADADADATNPDLEVAIRELRKYLP